MSFKAVERCRICGNTQLIPVLDVGVQALTGIFPKTREQRVTTGPLRLVKCAGSGEVCGLLQLAHSYEADELYGENYGYRSGLNPSMVAHLEHNVREVLARARLRPELLIIDIGSNDGTTLRAYPPDAGTLVGVDPTGRKFQGFYPPHIHLLPEFFSAARINRAFGGRKAAVITAFSMFYDLEEPLAFMREVAELLDQEGIWVFEQSYMPTMLAMNSYDTVCHEHLEYYGLRQVNWLAERSGLKLIDVEFNDVNGGSFCVFGAKSESRREPSARIQTVLHQEQSQGLETLRPYHDFAQRVADSRTSLTAFFQSVRREGRSVCGLGASTKGNVLLQYCGLTATDIEQIGEVNPDKFGAYTPGTLIPIVSEADVLARDPDYLLILPWHFRRFFESQPRYSRHRLVFPLPVLEVK